MNCIIHSISCWNLFYPWHLIRCFLILFSRFLFIEYWILSLSISGNVQLNKRKIFKWTKIASCEPKGVQRHAEDWSINQSNMHEYQHYDHNIEFLAVFIEVNTPTAQQICRGACEYRFDFPADILSHRSRQCCKKLFAW